MKKADSKFLLEVLKFEYSQRLSRVLGEAEIFDPQGNIIIKPDLKVRHKDSGYEYTVDRVEGDSPGNIQIVLRDPETPRFEAPPPSEEVLDEVPAVLAEDDLPIVSVNGTDVITRLDDADPEEEFFIVDEKDFENEYEVK
jgi:hypothetical protein